MLKLNNEAVIEQLSLEDPTMVSVIGYDTVENVLTGELLEVCSRQEAYEQYDIVGEIVNGDLIVFSELDASDDCFDFEIEYDEA